MLHDERACEMRPKKRPHIWLQSSGGDFDGNGFSAIGRRETK